MLSKFVKKSSSMVPAVSMMSLSKMPMQSYSSVPKEAMRDPQLGISTYMKNIYGTSLLSFGGILVGASIFQPYLPPTPALWGGLAFSLGGIIGFQMS